MKKKTFLIVYVCCVLAAALISSFYLMPLYSGRPFKSLDESKIESIYIAENPNFECSQKESEKIISELKKVKIKKRILGKPKEADAEGFFGCHRSIKFKNRKIIRVNILNHDLIWIDGEYYEKK